MRKPRRRKWQERERSDVRRKGIGRARREERDEAERTRMRRGGREQSEEPRFPR